MATWVTHLMIADLVLSECPSLHRRGFCIGSIAPDCNIENETWTEFSPPREVTHWMTSKRKASADCDRFLKEYFIPRAGSVDSEEYSFLLGYWAHLMADAEFQRFIREEKRVRASWQRIRSDAELWERAKGMAETWDSVKLLIPTAERMRGIAAIETDYLNAHPESGYLTEVLPLTSFPDYIDYLPPGCIARKVSRMPPPSVSNPERPLSFLALSREEYTVFIQTTVSLILQKLNEQHLLP